MVFCRGASVTLIEEQIRITDTIVILTDSQKIFLETDMETKEIVKSLGPMGEMFDVITERGILSALYLAALTLPIIISSKMLNIMSEDYFWVAGICIVFGLVISKITSEFLLNAIRRITEPVVLSAFHSVVKSKEIFPNYHEFREFREKYLDSENVSELNYLKARILKNESLLHTITYIMSSSIFALLMLGAFLNFSSLFGLSQPLIIVEIFLVGYILVATYFAEVSRAAAIGRSVGIAYIKSIKKRKGKKT